MNTLKVRGVRSVAVEEFHYGKLVVADDGPVHANSGYAVTYRSAGVGDPSTLMPAHLLGLSNSGSLDLDPLCAARGTLFFVELANRQSDVAIGRVRFRSERGERTQGRAYLQARIMVVKRKDWEAAAPNIVRWAGRHLLATPDLMRTPPAQRFDVGPTPMSLEISPELTDERCILAIPPEQRDRVASILNHLCFENGKSQALGGDCYQGEQCESMFLDDFAYALAVASHRRGYAIGRAPICFGLKTGVLTRGLQVSPSLAASDPGTRKTWSEVASKLAITEMVMKTPHSRVSPPANRPYRVGAI